MSQLGPFLLGLTALLAGAAAAWWFIRHTVRQSEDPGRMVFKWIATGVILVLILWMGASLQGAGYAAAFAVPIAGAAIGVALGIIWAPHLGAALARPLGSFYDGGSAEVEARPFYSIAHAKRKRGHYLEAIAHIRKQLERFPEDYEGWLLLAEIHAEDLRQHDEAQKCVEELLRHRHHHPKNLAFALNRSADWHLALASNREAARDALARVEALFPGTEMAHQAAQRIAHLTTDQMLANQKERPRLNLVHHDEYIGLQGQVADPRPPQSTPVETATRLVEQINRFPHDAEAREQLARVYAEEFARVDLAADQVEELIRTPGSGPKEIARWLNMLADFHIRVGKDRAAAETALRRVIEQLPGTASAAQAQSRLAHLEGELRQHQTTQVVALGSYEKDLGLRSGVPRNPGQG